MHPHGEFDIQQHDQILIVRCLGSWNIYTAQLLRDGLLNHGMRLSNAPWAVLMDVSEWGLGPLDMWPLLSKAKQWGAKHNQIAEAVVFDTHVQKMLTARMYKAVPDLTTDFFKDYAQALEWLSEQGMNHDRTQTQNPLFKNN